MPTAERRREISDTFFRQAIREHLTGDLLQASEKAWGAVSHYVAAMSEDKGLPVADNFAGTRRNAISLFEMLPGNERDQCRRLFDTVFALHINFYQESHDRKEVALGIRDARTLLTVLKRLDLNGTAE